MCLIDKRILKKPKSITAYKVFALEGNGIHTIHHTEGQKPFVKGTVYEALDPDIGFHAFVKKEGAIAYLKQQKELVQYINTIQNRTIARLVIGTVKATQVSATGKFMVDFKKHSLTGKGYAKAVMFRKMKII